MNIKTKANQIAKKVKIAHGDLLNLDSATKNKILLEIASQITNSVKQILQANKLDIEYAKSNNIDAAKLDRLTLDENKIYNIAKAVVDIANLPDPIGKISYDVKRENGLHIQRISVPIGIIFAIYESRPNVTSDVAALGFKSGNAVILRSGKESFHSSNTIAKIYRTALEKFNIDPNCVYYVDDTNREYVKYLLKAEKEIDVVIPRGGKDLIKAIMKNTKIPIFKHLDGNCHTYIESNADLEKAIKITLNAKMRRVGICGATESLLIDKKIANIILPDLVNNLANMGCEMRGDAAAQKIDSRIKKATKKDFYSEYLDKIISIKIVSNIKQAIKHINDHSSSHTESIITENIEKAQEFFQGINSAIVMHNASTQFADGGEFGLGAEVGIATGKLHARGPVGLEQLTTYKYIVSSECGIRP